MNIVWVLRVSVIGWALTALTVTTGCSSDEDNEVNKLQSSHSNGLQNNDSGSADGLLPENTGDSLAANDQPLSRREKSSNSNYREVEWIDLMPKEDLDALMNPPEYLADIAKGSAADLAVGPLSMGKDSLLNNQDDPYQRALTSTRIRPEMNNLPIRLPGFVVPLESNEQELVTTFFLVPFFGACIHVPPPPPNQIIFIEYKKGIKLESLYDPFWVEGTLKTELIENDMATAAYSIDVHKVELYGEEG